MQQKAYQAKRVRNRTKPNIKSCESDPVRTGETEERAQAERGREGEEESEAAWI